MKSCLPFAASPPGASWAQAPPAPRVRTTARRARFVTIIAPSPTLGNDVDQGGFAALDDRDAALERRREVLRIADGADRLDAHALRDLRVVDERIAQRGADMRAIDAAHVAVGHPLHVHEFL